MIRLDDPSIRYKDSFLEGAAEFHAEGRFEATYGTGLGYDLDGMQRRFGQFVRALRALGDPSRRFRGGYVDRVLWLVDGGEYVGQVSIRPELCTRYLITYGGHIGYSIRPSRRGRGYGNEILALALKVSEEMGLKKVLITCDSDNIASRKIIERNGGIFESAARMNGSAFRAEGRGRRRGVEKLRYWIELSPPRERARTVLLPEGDPSCGSV